MKTFFGRWWRELVAAVVVFLSRLATMPRTPWEIDEYQLSFAVLKYDPWRYRPNPPGYPLYVGFGKAVEPFLHDPYASLVWINVIACVIGVVALSIAFRRMIGDDDLGTAAALIFYLSAGMLWGSTLAMADATALMFLALTFWMVTRFPDEATDRRAIALGMFAGAAIGCRPQLCIPLIPAVAFACLALVKSWRQRGLVVAAAAVTCLVWFLPLMESTGGFDKLVTYQMRQVEDFAAHDAAESRGTMSSTQIALRFLAHPWGSKVIAGPLLLCVLLGAWPFLRNLRARHVPFVVHCLLHFAFILAVFDPADGVRYSLHGMMLTAYVAAHGLGVIRNVAQVKATPWLGALFFAALSWWYAQPALRERVTKPAPMSAAATWANANLAPNTVILAQPGLRPAAEYLMPKLQVMPIDKGLQELAGRADVPLVVLAEGGSLSPEAKNFEWEDSEAFRKITRNVFRRVTLDPVRDVERFVPINGVYAVERTVEGREWRWLQPEAAIRIPAGHKPALAMTFELSPDTPYSSTAVRIAVGGREVGVIDVKKEPVTTTIALPDGDVDIEIRAAQSFKPAEVLGNGDPRTLAVQLVRVEQR